MITTVQWYFYSCYRIIHNTSNNSSKSSFSTSYSRAVLLNPKPPAIWHWKDTKYFSLEHYSKEQLFVCQYGVMFILYVGTVQKNNSFP